MDEHRNIATLRSFTYDQYGISIYRYKELKSFCLQYNEKKAKIAYGISANASDGMPHASNNSSPTERKGIENALLREDIEAIEKAAVQVSEMTGVNIAPYILKSVTEDIAFEKVEYDAKLGRIPLGKTDFYACRRLFYHCLDQKDKRGKV